MLPSQCKGRACPEHSSLVFLQEPKAFGINKGKVSGIVLQALGKQMSRWRMQRNSLNLEREREREREHSYTWGSAPNMQ